MKNLIVLILSFFAVSVMAQDYDVSSIPSNILKGANAVVRFSETTLDIKSPELSTYKVKTAITVLNEKGDQWGGFADYYDKLSEITTVKVTYYNQSGRQIKKVKKNEIMDMAYTSSGSLYDDTRMKVVGPSRMEYPYTIVTEVEKTLKSSLSYPEWNIRDEEHLAVEYAILKLITPPEYDFRFKTINLDEVPTRSKTSTGEDLYEWVIKDLRAIKREFRGPRVDQVSPRIILAPSNFSMEGQSGSMDSWKEFGHWINQLNDGRDNLSDELIGEIQELTANVSSDREKIRLVYDYLQNNTRYVSIQLGIGGFQPFDALSVENNGYGDCKALSNFTYSLLKSIGIKSNYTLIYAGESADDILTDFPSQQFNHVILAVPMEKDTVWLECTSQEAPFNFLGGFTSDRHALMITDQGGELVKTPYYSAFDNSQIRHAEVMMDEEGNATATVTTMYKGLQYDDNYSIAKESKQDQHKYLLNSIRIPIFEVEDFSFEETRGEIPELTQTLNLNLKKFGSKSGKRIFFTPNLMNRGGTVLSPKDEERHYPLLHRYAYSDIDSVSYKLPEGFAPEFLPESLKKESEFGSFELSYAFDEEAKTLLVVRKLVIHKGVYAPSVAKDYFDFIKVLVEADKEKAILLKASD